MKPILPRGLRPIKAPTKPYKQRTNQTAHKAKPEQDRHYKGYAWFFKPDFRGLVMDQPVKPFFVLPGDENFVK